MDYSIVSLKKASDDWNGSVKFETNERDKSRLYTCLETATSLLSSKFNVELVNFEYTQSKKLTRFNVFGDNRKTEINPFNEIFSVNLNDRDITSQIISVPRKELITGIELINTICWCIWVSRQHTNCNR